ncbi:MAG: 16S rRNA (cytosine(1402)-N(4))-methyltransferase RsmH [Schleiferiaceae bacterium]|jgi:16S rRNA (cytosine1402-N4)-methyltransferase|nr:16S rRNA (cytosine(1402)-N(4))-methyltransferase RsmH [Schleiferiaceae bacterium]
MYHEPVLLHECLEGLNISPSGTYVDVTFGGGGHSKAIFNLLGPEGKLCSFDQDPDAKENTWEDSRFTFIPENFRHIKRFLRLYGIKEVDGILADLGVSSHQFDEGSRGFSLRFDGPLDMRMNTRKDRTAKDILAEADVLELTHIFRLYGELKNAHAIAHAIVKFREENELETTSDLNDCLERFIPKHKGHQFLAKVYQALRIEVNEELKVLEEFLESGTEILKPGGRMVIMSYHSLEDRLVKNYFRDGNFEGKAEKDFYGNKISPLKVITKKPVLASAEENARNSRATSAKLRIAEKK